MSRLQRKVDALPWKKVDLPVGHDVTEFGFFGLEVLPGDAYSSLVSKRAKKVAETTEGGPVASSKPALTRDVASNSKKRKVGAVVSTEMPECVQASSDDGDVGVEDGDAVLEDATEVVGEPVEGIRAAVPTDAAKTKKKKKKKKSKKARVDPGDEAEAGNEDVGEDDVTEEAVAAVATGPWGTLGLHPLLHKAVAKLGFSAPTPIQSSAIPPALRDSRDVVGAAETGSGKTLAFGLPILSRLLAVRAASAMAVAKDDDVDCGVDAESNTTRKFKDVRWAYLPALIITPTRELALQIREHLSAAAQYTAIRVAAAVGGLAQPKQVRLLDAHPDILVATPGRLHELIHDLHHVYLSRLERLQFLVLDEADRLVEKGHFEALEAVLSSLKRSKRRGDDEEAGGRPIPPAILEDPSLILPSDGRSLRRQTFLFSATLGDSTKSSVALVGGAVKASKPAKSPSTVSAVVALMKQVGQGGKPAVLNLSAASRDMLLSADCNDVTSGVNSGAGRPNPPVKSALKLPSGLRLSVMSCMKDEKDDKLYYFLLNHPGRTLVFVNAIHTLKKVTTLLTELGLPTIGLHAHMQQRQRLKNLDRFKAESHCVMVATDVAARGLDIPGVEQVVHYHVPLTVEQFVHRSGRTARAQASGFCLTLVSPAEHKDFQKITAQLDLMDKIPEFDVDHKYMKRLGSRMGVCRKICSIISERNSESADKQWMRSMADKLDIVLDDDDGKDSDSGKKSKKKKKNEVEGSSSHGSDAELASLRSQLRGLLSQPLVPSHTSMKFITYNPLLDEREHVGFKLVRASAVVSDE